MAKIQFKGIEEYTAKLARLSAVAEEQVLGAAVYDGAAIVADAVRQELEAVPTDEGHTRKKIGPSAADKQAVLDSLGITPLGNEKGLVNRKIGFTKDYVGPPTKNYPRGKPVLMLARSIRSGTSFMEGHDFIKSAVRRSRPAATEAMKKRVEQEIEKIMG